MPGPTPLVDNEGQYWTSASQARSQTSNNKGNPLRNDEFRKLLKNGQDISMKNGKSLIFRKATEEEIYNLVSSELLAPGDEW